MRMHGQSRPVLQRCGACPENAWTPQAGAAEMRLSEHISKCTDENKKNLAHGAGANSGKHMLSIWRGFCSMYSMPFTQVLQLEPADMSASLHSMYSMPFTR